MHVLVFSKVVGGRLVGVWQLAVFMALNHGYSHIGLILEDHTILNCMYPCKGFYWMEA